MKAEESVVDQDDDIAAEDDVGFPLKFPPDVEEAIAEVLPSNDPLDSPNFNPIDYINQLFPTEQSLSNIDDKIGRMRLVIRRLDGQIREAVRGQTNVGHDGRQSLEEAQRAIRELFLRIKDIKTKADRSEQMVKEITRDIKQLDHAKRHLTTSITTLNHVHMLVGGVESLKNLARRRQYGEIHQLLQAVVNVVEHFHKHQGIAQIRQLSDSVRKLQDELAMQIKGDFQDAYGKQGSRSIPQEQLAHACKVVDVLEKRVRDDLVEWYINLELAEYTVLFHESEDASWLDKIDRRYAWLRRVLVQYQQDGAKIFPPSWHVAERITERFCEVTRDDLAKLMTDRASSLEVKLLLFAIQKTTSFEKVLSQQFVTYRIDKEGSLRDEDGDDVRAAAADDDDEDENEPRENDNDVDEMKRQKKSSSPFLGMISSCFEPHLNVYIESQDKNLAELLDRFVQDYKSKGAPTASVEGGGVVLPSCSDLFVFYKKCMVQCSQLSTGEPLLQLMGVFQKYLKEYGARLLTANLPKTTVSGGLSFLKDVEVKLNSDELARTCCILSTAEYCLDTTQQLEEKLKSKVKRAYVERVHFTPVVDMFQGVITSCVQLLVQQLETSCDAPLTAMIKTHWQTVEAVGDQSPYVTAIGVHVRDTIPVIRNNLASARKYFTNFCLKFVNSFIPKFVIHLYKCKPVSTVGAEQLLLDAHSIKTILLDLPSVGSAISRKPPARRVMSQSYTKIVNKGMSRAEMILKIVMSPHDQAKPFVTSYLKLLENSDQGDFQKVLEMKGLKRSEQNPLMEEFRSQGPNRERGATSAAHSSEPAKEQQSSRIKKLERLIKRQF